MALAPALPAWFGRVEAATESLDRRAPHLVGVSGGLDSVVLLHLLVRLGFGQLVVCHYDHRLRGAEGAADAAFVAALAQRLGLNAVFGAAAPEKRGRASVETWARAERYRFFAEVARSRAAPSLFLGHQADDQIETVLFRLLRGTSALGRAGMRPHAERTEGGITLALHRPLLTVWRQDLLTHAQAAGLVWREDPTNAEPAAARNRLRHELLPLASEILGRDVKASLWRVWEIAEAEEDFLDAALPAAWRSETLSAADLRALPTALQRRVVHRWLQERGVADVGTVEVEAVRGLAHSPVPAKVNLAGNRHARRRAGKIFLTPDVDPGGQHP